jgi:hypothetical protein
MLLIIVYLFMDFKICLMGLGLELRALHLQGRCSTTGLLHLQSILLWLFWTWGSHELFAWAGLEP